MSVPLLQLSTLDEDMEMSSDIHGVDIDIDLTASPGPEGDHDIDYMIEDALDEGAHEEGDDIMLDEFDEMMPDEDMVQAEPADFGASHETTQPDSFAVEATGELNQNPHFHLSFPDDGLPPTQVSEDHDVHPSSSKTESQNETAETTQSVLTHEKQPTPVQSPPSQHVEDASAQITYEEADQVSTDNLPTEQDKPSLGTDNPTEADNKTDLSNPHATDDAPVGQHQVAAEELPEPANVETDAHDEQSGTHDPEHEDYEEHSDVDSIHPVTVYYEGNTLSLFPPMDENEVETYLLADQSIADEGLDALFQACREVLGDSIGDDEHLQLHVQTLDLGISEDSADCTKVSLRLILQTYLDLFRHDGVENPEPMLVTLTHKPRFSARLDALLSAVKEAKGLSQIDFLNTPHAEPYEGDDEEDQDGGENGSTKFVAPLKLPEPEQSPVADRVQTGHHATPEHVPEPVGKSFDTTQDEHQSETAHADEAKDGEVQASEVHDSVHEGHDGHDDSHPQGDDSHEQHHEIDYEDTFEISYEDEKAEGQGQETTDVTHEDKDSAETEAPETAAVEAGSNAEPQVPNTSTSSSTVQGEVNEVTNFSYEGTETQDEAHAADGFEGAYDETANYDGIDFDTGYQPAYDQEGVPVMYDDAYYGGEYYGDEQNATETANDETLVAEGSSTLQEFEAGDQEYYVDGTLLTENEDEEHAEEQSAQSPSTTVEVPTESEPAQAAPGSQQTPANPSTSVHSGPGTFEVPDESDEDVINYDEEDEEPVAPLTLATDTPSAPPALATTTRSVQPTTPATKSDVSVTISRPENDIGKPTVTVTVTPESKSSVSTSGSGTPTSAGGSPLGKRQRDETDEAEITRAQELKRQRSG
ncbi:hypothetical protein EJ06DRAFT_253613 [Trichodelitschia bisporula]|uniref:Uncharacterized protein n=1 Tax=Trichodelitschia bisporula TaxID=703511 RepID=A0A6G1HIX2_9PEZI|nr:hypothetical protein EJ06DRAFT_253613 [Trichodelitschia bisporula]